MVRIDLPMFLWIPPDRTTKWSVLINSVDVSDDIISGKFTRGVIGEEMGCEIELQNSGEAYTGLFSIGNIIQFKHNYSDGSTVQFEGKVDRVDNKIGNFGFTLVIKGSHYTADLLDKTVTAEFTNSSVSDILTNLVTNFLTGFTYITPTTVTITTNTISGFSISLLASSPTITVPTVTGSAEITSAIIDKIVWKNKPFFDCVLDLMNIADVDVYVNESKDFKLFVKGSIQNQNEAIVSEDGIELRDFGKDVVDVKNKIIVYGEAGGLPIIHTSEDLVSQDQFGTKEEVIQDSAILDENQARLIGNSNKDRNKNPITKGTVILPFLTPYFSPGDMVYVVSTAHDITDLFRLSKYTFFVPNETMEVIFSQEVGIPQLFKDRIKKDLAQETITNPNKMKYSYNFTFDNLSNVNQAASSNIEVVDGNLKLTSGSTSGVMINLTKSTPIDVSSVEIRVIGEAISGNVTYKISTDGTDNYQTISSLNTATSVTKGNQLKIRLDISSPSTRIDSLAILYK